LGEENNVTIHPHSFRHSSVTVAVNEAQKNNINLREVLKFSRHSKLETLQIYVDSIENKQGELSSMVSKAIHLKKVD
jgi:integrase/recombinase XerC